LYLEAELDIKNQSRHTPVIIPFSDKKSIKAYSHEQ